MNIRSGAATDRVLPDCDIDIIVVRLSKAARCQLHALTRSAGDRVVRHQGGDLIVVSDFVQRAIDAAKPPVDPEAERKGILHRVALNASIQGIARTIAAGGKQRPDRAKGEDANSGIILQGVATDLHLDMVMGAVIDPNADSEAVAVIVGDCIVEDEGNKVMIRRVTGASRRRAGRAL